jgi:riboflavin kinase/FMN adenylyltransferase
VGSAFVFGHQRTGNVELLQRLGRELGFNVHGIAAVSLDDVGVSSTRIREEVQRGRFDRASQLLGREYTLGGAVVVGDALGRTLGFPTANLDVRGMLVPPAGVYAAHARVAGQRHRAVVNIGLRPTLHRPGPELRVEAHCLNFSGDLYGQEMELTFVARLRQEKQFGSLDDLKAQISKDVLLAEDQFRAC